jgi:tRNA-modifying protein YgfZ
MVDMASATVIDFAPQILPDRAVLRVAGDGALAFLHGLLTSDLSAAKPAYAALLTPQGKILHDVFVVPDGDTVWIDVARTQAADLLKRLMMYRLRAKLEIAIDDSKAVMVSLSPMDGLSFEDPRTSSIGQRAITSSLSVMGGPRAAHPEDGQSPARVGGSGPADDAKEGRYEEARILLGLADSVDDIGTGELFVHEANLDQLNGVSFTKGCYVGQEVVSRTHHRHTARNRILPVRLDGTIAKGADIMSGEQRVGTMLSSRGDVGLALMRMDRLSEASSPLKSGVVSVHVEKPSWATFELAIPEVAK